MDNDRQVEDDEGPRNDQDLTLLVSHSVNFECDFIDLIGRHFGDSLYDLLCVNLTSYNGLDEVFGNFNSKNHSYTLFLCSFNYKSVG